MCRSTWPKGFPVTNLVGIGHAEGGAAILRSSRMTGLAAVRLFLAGALAAF